MKLHYLLLGLHLALQVEHPIRTDNPMRQLDKFQLIPIKDAEGTALRLRLWFVGREQPLEFETSGKNAMIFLSYLQEFQAKHGIPIPQLAYRSKKGKWKPYVVKTEK